MNATLQFDPADFEPPVVRLIMAKAESAHCPPSEALRILLNELAAESGFGPEGAPNKEKEAA